jgi:hypothetical protein
MMMLMRVLMTMGMVTVMLLHLSPLQWSGGGGQAC